MPDLDPSPTKSIACSQMDLEEHKKNDFVPPSVDPVTGVSSKDVIIDPDSGVSARLYLPKSQGENKKKLPILLYFHGGAFITGSAFSLLWHNFHNTLVSQARLVAVSANYRLAPRNLLPAAYDDSWTALKWVLSCADEWLAEHGDLDRLLVSGDSAGANIAHNLAMRAGQGGVRIEGIVIVHPFFWGIQPIGPEKTDTAARAMYDGVFRVVLPPGMNVDDPRINPIAEGAPSLAGLGCRRAMVCVAGMDVLVDRGRTYYEALKESGWEGEVELFESEGEDHCFHLHKPQCEKALELLTKLVAFFAGARDQDKMAHSSGIDCSASNYHSLCIPNLCSKSSNIAHGATPNVSCGLQTTLENYENTVHVKAKYKLLHLLNDFKIKWNGYDERLKCIELEEGHGELQYRLAMNKEKMQEELWMVGSKKRITSCLICVLVGFVFSFFLLMIKAM